jgi:hypothetical protein
LTHALAAGPLVKIAAAAVLQLVPVTDFGGVTHEQLVRILFPYHGASTGRPEPA